MWFEGFFWNMLCALHKHELKNPTVIMPNSRLMLYYPRYGYPMLKSIHADEWYSCIRERAIEYCLNNEVPLLFPEKWYSAKSNPCKINTY